MKKVTFLISFLIAWSVAMSQTYVKPSALSTATKNAFRTSLGIDTLLQPQQIKTSVPPDFVIKQRGTVFSVFPVSDSIQNFSDTDLNTLLDSCITLLIPHNGGKISLSPMNASNLTPIQFLSDNTTIEGSGIGITILKLAANADSGLSSAHYGLIQCDGVDNFTIRNIELDGNGANQSKIGHTALMCGVNNYSSGTTNDYTTVENCYIHDFTQDAVVFSHGSGHRISNCICTDNYWNGPTLLTTSTDCIVENCYVTGSADVGISAYGTGHIIKGNIVWDCNGTDGDVNTKWGIGLESYTVDPEQTLVIGNYIYGDLRYGIYLNTAYNCQVSNNNVYDISNTNAGYGIRIDAGYNNLVSNNMVSGTYQSGLYVYGSDSLLITGNVFETGFTNTNADGISIQNNASFNMLKNNYSTGKKRGIAIQSGSVDNRLVGNDFRGIDGNDVYDGGTTTRYKSNWGVKAGAWITDY